MTTKAIIHLLAFAPLYLALQGLRWAANTWGVEAVALGVMLLVLAIPVEALWALWLERKRDAEPWVEIPWEARR